MGRSGGGVEKRDVWRGGRRDESWTGGEHLAAQQTEISITEVSWRAEVLWIHIKFQATTASLVHNISGNIYGVFQGMIYDRVVCCTPPSQVTLLPP